MPPISADSMRRRFAEYLGLPGSAGDEPVHESILIQDGFYCGRKFSRDGYVMVWFVEEQQVKIYSPQGALKLTASVHDFLHQVDAPATQQRRAA